MNTGGFISDNLTLLDYFAARQPEPTDSELIRLAGRFRMNRQEFEALSDDDRAELVARVKYAKAEWMVRTAMASRQNG